MGYRTIGLGSAMVVSAAAVLAHTGVENPAVLARMDGMKAMADRMEVLVPMARGEEPFDAARVAAALDALEQYALEAPELFRAPESDPASEALPAIWEDYADFEARSDDLIDAVRAASSTGIEGRDALVPAVRAIGAACSACHEDYRAEQ